MKKIIRFMLFHAFCFIGGTVLFVLSFRTSIAPHMVFFYRGVLFLFVLTVLMIGFLGGYMRYGNARSYTIRDIILAAVIFFCVNLVVFTHFPVTADRSMTVFLLGYMNSQPGRVFTTEELHSVFVKTYVEKNQALEKRFSEQLESGTLWRKGNGFQISTRGMILMQVYSWVANLFGLENNNLWM